MGSSWTRDGTCVPCIGRWIPIQWTTYSTYSSDRDISLKLGFQLVRLKELTYLGVGEKKRYQIGRRRLSPRSPLEREVTAGPIQAPFLAHQLCPVLSGAALWGDR